MTQPTNDEHRRTMFTDRPRVSNSNPDDWEIFAGELHRRQRHLGGPKKISTVVSELMARRGYAQGESADELIHGWQAVVGVPLVHLTRPGTVRRGVLEVFVSSSAVLQELTFQKRQLLAKLARHLPDFKIRDLRFRVGQLD